MSKKRSWSDDQLIAAVKSSQSYSEVIKKLGLNLVGGNQTSIRKHIKRLDLDTSHFLGKRHMLGKQANNFNKGIPIQDILVENSTYSRYHLKRRLLKDSLIENKCSICNLGPIWNNKELVLVLDHVNGVYNDNRLENLRMLCPNCNSQQETFAGRNKK